MEESARRLQALKTDDPTVHAQKVASGRVQKLIDSLKPDKPKGGGQQQQSGGGGGRRRREGAATASRPPRRSRSSSRSRRS